MACINPKAQHAAEAGGISQTRDNREFVQSGKNKGSKWGENRLLAEGREGDVDLFDCESGKEME